MPRKGNPQHNARKRVARDRAKAEHEAGFLQQRKRDQKRRRAILGRNDAELAALAAVLFPNQQQP